MGRREWVRQMPMRSHMTWMTQQNGMTKGMHKCPKNKLSRLCVQGQWVRIHQLRCDIIGRGGWVNEKLDWSLKPDGGWKQKNFLLINLFFAFYAAGYWLSQLMPCLSLKLKVQIWKIVCKRLKWLKHFALRWVGGSEFAKCRWVESHDLDDSADRHD